MKPLDEILATIDSCIERYEVQKLSFTQDQAEIARDLSTALHWLTAHKIEYKKKWMSVWFNSKGKSEAQKEREADFQVPELYLIRNFMASGNKCLEVLRSTISAFKNG